MEQLAKKATGEAAAALIQNGMLVGIGTGSTVNFFIDALIKRCRQGLQIKAIASSERSFKQAKEGGIPLISDEEVTSLDLTVDGADEIDPLKRMIKGGGGALLREKILASISNEMIVIVDQTKVVEQLGKTPLPLEIVPFSFQAITLKLEKLGFQGYIRKTKEGMPFLTENGNFIFDIHFSQLLSSPESIHEKLRSVPGVVETGFFFNLAGRVIVGFSDGHVEIRS